MIRNEVTEIKFETNDAEFDQAILSALENVQNCSKRNDGFNRTSIENFKRNYALIFNLLEKNGLKATEPNDWMIWLSEQANNNRNQKRKKQRKQHSICSDSKLILPSGSGQIKTAKSTSTTVDDFINIIMKLSIQNKNFKLEILNNSGQDANFWFEQFELQTPRWTDDTRPIKVVTLFQDDDLQKFRKIKIGNTSFAEKKENLKINFKQDRTSDIQCDFYVAKQRPDETVEKFSKRLINYTNEVIEQEKVIMEKSLINVFVRGLVPSLRKILATSTSNDFDELVRVAKLIEQYEREEKETTSLVANIENISLAKETELKKSTCIICDKENHETANCFELKSAKDFVKNKQRKLYKRVIRDKKEEIPNTKEYCSYCNK
ncbi:unnamed protein product [Brachionus calyciflorus]|uniref:Uncharacterized protein n=1 Tax=Brachionus calyciflorus TaxID=104777 RepID=A0A813M9G5_9BILA|nr:unnamed protein product [Brachionus calyciflorus]